MMEQPSEIRDHVPPMEAEGRNNEDIAIAMSNRLDAFKEGIRGLSTSIDGIRGSVVELSDRVNGLEHRLSWVQRRVESHLGAIESAVARARAETESDYEAFFAVAQSAVLGEATLLGYDRLRVLWQAVRNVAPLGLPAIEVGAYRGGSALFLAQAFRLINGEDVELLVFDTFAGHPESSVGEQDSAHHTAGRFGDVDIDAVRNLLAPFPQISLHVGDALETLPSALPREIGFAHIDVDLYRPTLEALRRIAPRLARGGVVVVDDFGAPKCPGVVRGTMEFLDEQPSLQLWRPESEQAVLINVGKR